MAFNDLFGGKFKSQFNLDSQFGLLAGITKDASGAALGSCVVVCFSTVTNTFIGKATSDGSGNYRVFAPTTPTTAYCVAYKPGSPDVAGTTVNTLIGTGGY
jgi:hypothetical protein